MQKRHIIRNNNIGAIMMTDIVFALVCLALLSSFLLFFSTQIGSIHRTIKSNKTEATMLNIKNQITKNAKDVDNDTYFEPWKPAGTDGVPVGVTGSSVDEWGSGLRYCAWDPGTLNGSDATYSNNNILPPKVQLIAKIISPGRDKQFQTQCTDTNQSADDIVMELFHSEIVNFFYTVQLGCKTLETEVSLLLHGEGSNGGTLYVDSSPNAKTLSTFANVTNSTTVKKLGNASLFFPGNGYLYYQYSPDFAFGSGDFTIDFWVNFPYSATINNVIMTNRAAADYGGFWIGILPTTNQLFMGAGSSTSSGWNVVNLTSTVGIGNTGWNHVAFVRSGATTTLYLNGTSNATFNSSTLAIYDPGSPFAIGWDVNWPSHALAGYFDEIRITKGIARWKSNFTPPTKEDCGGGIAHTCKADSKKYPNLYMCSTACATYCDRDEK